jgi:hypothetical protein
MGAAGDGGRLLPVMVGRSLPGRLLHGSFEGRPGYAAIVALTGSAAATVS